jgi:AAA ATPase containing von Willebrand factor type A (vWA) domain
LHYADFFDPVNEEDAKKKKIKKGKIEDEMEEGTEGDDSSNEEGEGDDDSEKEDEDGDIKEEEEEEEKVKDHSKKVQ